MGYNTRVATNEAEEIQKGLYTGVNSTLEHVKTKAAKGHYGGIDLDGKCPHCKMLQSWAAGGDQAKWIGTPR